VHRLSQRRREENQPRNKPKRRSLIIVFSQIKDRDCVLRHLKNLKDKEESQHYSQGRRFPGLTAGQTAPGGEGLQTQTRGKKRKPGSLCVEPLSNSKRNSMKKRNSGKHRNWWTCPRIRLLIHGVGRKVPYYRIQFYCNRVPFCTFFFIFSLHMTQYLLCPCNTRVLFYICSGAHLYNTFILILSAHTPPFTNYEEKPSFYYFIITLLKTVCTYNSLLCVLG
jgi:hypothetical protein